MPLSSGARVWVNTPARQLGVGVRPPPSDILFDSSVTGAPISVVFLHARRRTTLLHVDLRGVSVPLADLTTEESPITQGEFEAFTYGVKVRGCITMTGTHTHKAFDNGENDVTADVFETGTVSHNGIDTFTMPRLRLLDQDLSPYRIVVYGTMNGQTQSVTTVIEVRDEKGIGSA